MNLKTSGRIATIGICIVASGIGLIWFYILGIRASGIQTTNLSFLWSGLIILTMGTLLSYGVYRYENKQGWLDNPR